MAPQAKVAGPASYFPSIEKTYGRPVAHWLALLDTVRSSHEKEATDAPDVPEKIAAAIAEACPLADPDDAKARDACGEKLARSGARLVVTQAKSALAIVLRASPEWEVLHEDRIAVVFGKRDVRT